MRRTAGALTVGFVALLAACAQPGERAIQVETRLDEDVPVPPDAAAQVRHLTAVREAYDENGDGFVSRGEAESYYRRYFAGLDDNNDGRLSRAELKPEVPGPPDTELYFEELIGATEREYVDVNIRHYDLRADLTTDMMSTRDFDDLLRDPDPAGIIPRPNSPAANY